MAQIFSIGKLEKNGSQYEVCLKREFVKALKGLGEFDCVLLILISDSRMRIVTARSDVIDEKRGRLVISRLSDILEISENDFPMDVVDIKPYMPCEDTVFTASGGVNRSVPVKESGEDSFEAEYCGEIRNTSGVVYLQFDELPEVIGEVIRVAWWFNRFEDKKYRRILSCSPPYECEEKIGIFASRSPVRPNPIALTIAKVESIDRDRRRVHINAIDCFDHTPFLGIFDYDANYDRCEAVRMPGWAADWPKEMTFVPKETDVDCMARALDEQAAAGAEATTNTIDAAKEALWQSESSQTEPLSGLPDTYEFAKKPTHLVVRGARENNLKSINVEIPYGKITAVVGVSGSGKSSLVKDTIYAECKRRMEYLSNDNAGFIKPAMDVMTGCIPTVMITQKEIQANANSTLGTFSGIYHHLRIIFASIGTRHYKNDSQVAYKLTPSSFSFLDPEARCPRCNGTGLQHRADAEKIITSPKKSLLDGASPFLGKLKNFIDNPNANWMKGQVVALAKQMNVDLAQAWEELPEAFRETVLYGDETRKLLFSYDSRKNGRKGEIERTAEGIIPIINRLYIENAAASMADRFMSTTLCEMCHGERLSGEGRLVTVAGVRYPICAKMTFDMLRRWMSSLPCKLPASEYEPIKEHIASIISLCDTASSLGIAYLELNRPTSEISGGEAQRLKLLSAFQNHMSGILYIFDEPSKKLSSREYGFIINMMKQLIEEGNTVLMVEHNLDMIKAADYVIEIGPAAGERGGYLLGEGTFDSVISHKGAMLGRYIENAATICSRKQYEGKEELFHISHVTYHTLCDVSVDIHKRALTCITGVSGSGKSSLLYGGILPQMEKASDFDEVVLVESKIQGNSSRSIVATYAGMMDEIRSLFAGTAKAKQLGYTEADFSFNRGAGRCEYCKGDGRIKIPFTQDSYRACHVCHGGRYGRELEEIRYRGKSIVDILKLSVDEAGEFFDEENAATAEKCRLLSRVGLGYLRLNQATGVLSGGEAARLKIACCLMKSGMKNALFLLDEPTCGLHFSDIDNLISLLYELIESGNTVVAIEHNTHFLAAADYTITCGPGAGAQGGKIC